MALELLSELASLLMPHRPGICECVGGALLAGLLKQAGKNFKVVSLKNISVNIMELFI